MRNIVRLVAAGAVAFPIIIGSAGIASAGTDDEAEVNHAHGVAFVGEDGAFLHALHASAHENGDTSFHELFLAAGDEGAAAFEAEAFTEDGNAFFESDFSFSGPHGAGVGFEDSSVETGDHFGNVDHDHDDDDDDDDHHGNGHHGNHHDNHHDNHHNNHNG
ncbi:hypothetical protein ALI22I_11905 [Saccharothrix sp. ALI-22-I]|uniref:hypothetical protein n=1 Tax=Saccharothrix sp. ALI-22-I TaxID=1933778 RepID=UPI00097C45CE|nr:hypothetical protein [Saccharothrix sp. ALI-22-I]ONI90441.1 hypothetical protein ALI22I_11905 [Saccharothrix sp. ALI-22-I]